MRIIGGAIIAAVALAAAVGAEGGARVELPLDGGWSGSASGDDGTVRSGPHEKPSTDNCRFDPARTAEQTIGQSKEG